MNTVLLFTLWRTLGLLTGLLDPATADCLNQRECKMYGSGVVQPFNGSAYHVRTSCSVILTRFSHHGVDCDITAQRGPSGLLTSVEVVINKIRTFVHEGAVVVETKRASLPYDHTYQHVFRYGAHTRLSSKVLPLTVTWHDTAQGIDSVWVRLEGASISGMGGLCGQLNIPANAPQLITKAVLEDDTCVIMDSLEELNMVCKELTSQARPCLMAHTDAYLQLCQQNAYSHTRDPHVTCSFFWDLAHKCGPDSSFWSQWRNLTQCPEPVCPGDLTYQELGNAFIPTCSTPRPRACDQDMTSTCICPPGKVLNDRTKEHYCVSMAGCPCVYGNSTYPPGSYRNTKCQTCECVRGKWECSEDICPKRCSVESQFVTSFDGKHFRLPGKCAYVAAQGLNWTLTVHFSKRSIELQRVEFKIFHESYVFSNSRVMFQSEEIRDLHRTALATVFWQSSMYVQVHIHSGLSVQVQMSPEIQVYMSLPKTQNGTTKGLCGNFNGNSGDDFTTSSGIVENSAGPFALSWSLDTCEPNISPICINMDNEIFADEHCNQLRDPNGIFGSCHPHVPYDQYYQTCITKTCQCQSGLQSCLCVALGNYAKACASAAVSVGDWRKATNCTVTCEANQVFQYATRVCNHTCRSLAVLDPTCELEVEPVEGCSCPEGTYINTQGTCSPRMQCECHDIGGVPPGPVVYNGIACICEGGRLNCPVGRAFFCGGIACPDHKVCVHCPNFNNTAQKTCESLSKPASSSEVCTTGCYCPEGQYEDHYGLCVFAQQCTCVFEGIIYHNGESVLSYCKACTCNGGHWVCTEEPDLCPGRCQVFGNGHYQTFDSKWFKFDGNCQYTLVEENCGGNSSLFSVKVESIPCCDEQLTCSRKITINLASVVILVLGDMETESWNYRLEDIRILPEHLYSVQTVGLYIVVSSPPLGLTVIWDKNTRVTVLLDSYWRGRVCGLCGNFDSSEANDTLIGGSGQVFSTLEFGNSWKTGTPPCNDVIIESFPCQRQSYCFNWAETHCRIILGDTFKECHLKVEPAPYYQACVLEACACEFEGKFLGLCTAVAAYAEACSGQNVCIRWRTPELCPVYCDYYNKEGQCMWHYDPCGKALTCGRYHKFSGKLEGCFPTCPEDAPYFDENTRRCTTLKNCTCLYNSTVLKPGTKLESDYLICIDGHVIWDSPTPTPSTATTASTPFPVITRTTTRPIPTPQVSLTTAAPPPTAPPTTTAPPAPSPCECIDTDRKARPCGAVWKDGCELKECKADREILATRLPCPTHPVPNCPRDQKAVTWIGCCKISKCNCRCEVSGDPHYTTFQGLFYDFMGECTYTLVQERSPQYHFSIVMDTFFCNPSRHDLTCAKGITMKFRNHTVTLIQQSPAERPIATLNTVCIHSNYEEQGIGFEISGRKKKKVTVCIKEIRSCISMEPYAKLTIDLAMEHFENNTEGQCGECGGSSCVRPGGKREEDTCCPKTALDWIYPNPQKPRCASAPRNESCGPPPPPPTPCPAAEPLCNIFDSPEFKPCKDVMYKDLENLKKNCIFDVCYLGPNLSCSMLAQAAELCRKAGICVEWRPLAGGICNEICSDGKVYQECRKNSEDYCCGSQRMPGYALAEMQSGCFCPDHQSRAGKHTDVCVDVCTDCQGPHGEPKQPGDSWESNCEVCICNNRTKTTECHPRPTLPPPVCGSDSDLVADCCGVLTCERRKTLCEREREAALRHAKGRVGVFVPECDEDGQFRPLQCHGSTSYCWCVNSYGQEIPGTNTPPGNPPPDCGESACGLHVSWEILTLGSCSFPIQLSTCEGQCVSGNSTSSPRWLLMSTAQPVSPCQEASWEERVVPLECDGYTPIQFTYRYITSCHCVNKV